MNNNKPTHDALVDAIYDSALDPVKWKDTLNQLSTYLNASAINLIGLQVQNYDNPFLLSQNIPSDYGKDYQSYWREHDIWVQAGIDKGLNGGGKTLTGDMLVDRRSFLKSTFYNEWLAEQNISDVLSTNLWDDNPNTPKVILCFFRGVGQDSFHESDRLNLHYLAQHLNRAFSITSQLKLSEQKNVLEESIFDSIGHALFVLNEDRKIIKHNAAATRLLSGFPGLIKIRHERLVALGYQANPSIDEAIALVDRGHHAEIVFTSNHLGAIRETHHARLTPLNEVVVWPLANQAHYLLLIEKNGEIKQETLRAFCALFNMTASEQQVLLGLMQDATPEEIALTLNVSLTTIRSHIQHIRQKSGVRRITELVRMALIATRSL
ncbi:helix-turn-helix transcriptional regulator [Nitrosomonas sp.]|uniref:helix-turn-helix transcriptional regulator n=1 Tax=Nitrosomonas sp. TaxID=42353 RepID=UPI001D2EE2D4|nr:helix-turn-helix transcriptional regulator [Nitrosomonas sp.]MBX3617348.1 helix-turn-helix transcriptional regulator [Nitrosomonas sp.]